MMKVLFLLFAILFHETLEKRLPVVIWHGMGDTWDSSFMKRLSKLINSFDQKVYVKSVKITGPYPDRLNGYLMNANEQIEIAYKDIKDDKNLQDGFIGIGISQGSQFLRGLLQRHPNPPMKKLISIGGQHQGIYGFTGCTATSFACRFLLRKITQFAYREDVQNVSTQSNYWHDPIDEKNYATQNSFLADINQAKKLYKENLLKLEKMVLIMFKRDSMVYPKESSHFGFYSSNPRKAVLPMNQTELYEKDLLGLKEMNENGKIDFITLNGDHLEFSEEWFKTEIVKKYIINN